MRRMIIVAVMSFSAMTAHAAKPSCQDDLAHVLNFGVPRTALSQELAEDLPETLAKLFGPMYEDPCGRGKSLQINVAFGSDYEILDWMERGSVDGGIVPDLSLWLLHYDHTPLFELNLASSSLPLLRALKPAPVCMQYDWKRWRPCAANADAAYAALLVDIAIGKSAGARRVMFASHLSSTGFLDPIERAFDVFSRFGEDEQEEMWERLFAAAHFTIDSKRDPFALALEEVNAPDELTVIAFPEEEALTVASSAPASGEKGSYRGHLVVSSGVSVLFKMGTLVRSSRQRSLLPKKFEELLEQDHPPRPLEIIVRGDPASGGRGYAFTINESLRLLAQQQRSSGQSDLALVLPGGGVKAAYQSKIVDHLYKNNHLRNADLGGKNGTLLVNSVLGTSGGALLGYFVAQLGEKGPFDLSRVLWRPYGMTLRSDDVFDVTDMLRYVGLVWTFMIFCIVLALVSGTYNSHFYGRSVTPHGAWRWRLMTLLVMLVAVPILIRNVSGADDLEHVPVVEAIFYSILTLLVMFCDQCLIYSPNEVTEARRGGLLLIVLGVLGGAFVVASIAGLRALQEPVSIGLAFATMSIIFLGSPWLLLYASGRLGDARRRLIDAVVSLVAVIVLCAFGVPGMTPPSMRYLVAFETLIGVAVFAYWYANLPKRNKLVTSTMTFLTLLATAVLCWSEMPGYGPPGLQFMNAPAMEETHLAPFFALTGCLLLVIAVLGWVYQRREYALRNGEDFAVSAAVLLGYAMITSAVVTVISIALPDLVHGAEITLSFWTALTLIGGVLAAIIIAAAPRWPVLRRAVSFLTSEHPNGSLLPRRYARMLALTTLSLIWWNTMVAPALYSNVTARKYLKRAVAQFDLEFRRAAGDNHSHRVRGFIPTANFVVPTNTLDGQNVTRYFLFLTEKTPPLDRPRRIVGAEWRVYSTTSRYLWRSDCREVITPQCVEFVHDVVFASGSPFPIFAAHRVKIPGQTRNLSLIDGGYSNDIPIDAARTIAARQVLVVHSSPVTEEVHEHRQTKSFSPLLPGMMVRNVTRLPGFMFERSQQVDRVSRQNLFVVSFSPKLDPGESWPGLAQFDTPTVEALIFTAEKNLHERIGLVESWGMPWFRFSQQVPAPTAPPATKKDLASPRRARPEAR